MTTTLQIWHNKYYINDRKTFVTNDLYQSLESVINSPLGSLQVIPPQNFLREISLHPSYGDPLDPTKLGHPSQNHFKRYNNCWATPVDVSSTFLHFICSGTFKWLQFMIELASFSIFIPIRSMSPHNRKNPTQLQQIPHSKSWYKKVDKARNDRGGRSRELSRVFDTSISPTP